MVSPEPLGTMVAVPLRSLIPSPDLAPPELADLTVSTISGDSTCCTRRLSDNGLGMRMDKEEENQMWLIQTVVDTIYHS